MSPPGAIFKLKYTEMHFAARGFAPNPSEGAYSLDPLAGFQDPASR